MCALACELLGVVDMEGDAGRAFVVAVGMSRTDSDATIGEEDLLVHVCVCVCVCVCMYVYQNVLCVYVC